MELECLRGVVKSGEGVGVKTRFAVLHGSVRKSVSRCLREVPPRTQGSLLRRGFRV